MPAAPDAVFINVPFDNRYKKLFDALVFAVHDCGFVARCAREEDDGSEIRLAKLYKIIGECRFGIHDLSRTTLDSKNRLPRFNMPLELGIFLGAKRFGGGGQSRKACLILDSAPYRYQVFCSDIAGQDIRPHGNNVVKVIKAVRGFLRTRSNAHFAMPDGTRIAARYSEFLLDLPRMCKLGKLTQSELEFLDYRSLVLAWIAEHTW